MCNECMHISMEPNRNENENSKTEQPSVCTFPRRYIHTNDDTTI